jgi:hypothetical protein
MVRITGFIRYFIAYLNEKLLAAKPLRAIFAIPKNDVDTAHLKGTDR